MPKGRKKSRSKTSVVSSILKSVLGGKKTKPGQTDDSATKRIKERKRKIKSQLDQL